MKDDWIGGQRISVKIWGQWIKFVIDFGTQNFFQNRSKANLLI